MHRFNVMFCVLPAAFLLACGGSGSGRDVGEDVDDAAAHDTGDSDSVTSDSTSPGDAAADAVKPDVDDAEPADVSADTAFAETVDDTGNPDVPQPRTFTVMTFNTGTSDNLDHNGDPDGYSNEFAFINAEYFSNNLAWLTARTGLRTVIDTVKPDIVGFQELYFDPNCDELCEDLFQSDPTAFEAACAPDGQFVCSLWSAVADFTVRAALGPDYAIACAPDHPDNCVGVRKAFGTLKDCADGPCVDGLDGMRPPDGCSGGARVATAVVSIAEGPEIAFVDVHTVAGTNIDCRLSQLKQVFEDRGDGKPAAFGNYNIVVGDMNIDPFLMSDASVTYWNSKVGDGLPFHYISSSDVSGPNTHPFSFTKLDHVISDTLKGTCVVLGVSEGTSAPVSDSSTYFDHRPVFCTVEMP